MGIGRSASGSESFVWDDVMGMRSLRDTLTDDFGLDLADWTLLEASGISDVGRTIAGNGINPDGNQEAWVATIPEPSSVTLLALGALVLAHRKLPRYVGCRSYRAYHGDWM